MSIQNNPDVSVPLSIQTCGEDNSVQSWNTSGTSIWKGNTPFPVSFLHVVRFEYYYDNETEYCLVR